MQDQKCMDKCVKIRILSNILVPYFLWPQISLNVRLYLSGETADVKLTQYHEGIPQI